MKHLKTILILLALVFGYGLVYSANAATSSELQSQIDAKTRELQNVQAEISSAQAQMAVISKQSQSLDKELKTTENTLNQLNLSIKSSTLNIQKLTLEIEDLNSRIGGIGVDVEAKKKAIGLILAEIQKNDNEGTLQTFLKSMSLADSLLEMQSLTNLQENLSVEISSLNKLSNDLENNVRQTADKKRAIQTENVNLVNRKAIIEDQKDYQKELLAESKNQEKIYQENLDRLAEKQAEIAAEREKIEQELKAKLDPSSVPASKSGILAKPCLGPIVQQYGRTAFALKAYKNQFHNGLDFDLNIGDPIFSAEDGKVVATGDLDLYCPRQSYGRFIVITHNNNLTTLYGHLSRIIVKSGDTVERGQLIGYAGNTGYSTGPHLHFTVYASSSFYMGASKSCRISPYGADLNPNNYL
ncbi:MAG TPA: peptidoglycan DD-metalloendopeptidase family protein [Candidatus Colwellbacteria bacterium]|mgnify:CR=1 FL=1|nr:peptidoglycan DD-metalloendopeptidase family protein [Candidatus Colwellbacteria bacterium]HQA96087.1 peptidoglycan DD-metalloendopeptidase family protein [Candidatus Colwellbacteria bacterium]